MKYRKWYEQIVERAKLRGSLDGYFEKHHIIPKSLGGTNSQDNIIVLTAREHFICHLLVKMTTGEDRAKMAYALHRMLLSKNQLQHRYTCPSRLYEAFRKENAKWRKIHATGRKLSDDARRRIGEATSSRIGPNKGKKFSEETRHKMSLARSRKSKLGATNSDHQRAIAREI